MRNCTSVRLHMALRRKRFEISANLGMYSVLAKMPAPSMAIFGGAIDRVKNEEAPQLGEERLATPVVEFSQLFTSYLLIGKILVQLIFI